MKVVEHSAKKNRADSKKDSPEWQQKRQSVLGPNRIASCGSQSLESVVIEIAYLATAVVNQA